VGAPISDLEVTGTVKARRRGARAGKTNPDRAGEMRLRIERAIRAIPRGKVSTYGAIARAAGFPGAARQVAATLRRSFGLPWQRVLGAGGEIKLTGDSAIEQRFRLQAEGVRFRGRKVDMKTHEFKGLHQASPRQKRQVRRKNS
jgi:methylated-DNA-protein-cysteine methyltransferase related protein